ncbi:MAG TPA: hypothetical protein ENK32_04575 [Anaerolineae bacterium]|nr:hypothetical protein [Anaerolineae bacterium]
MNNNNLSQYKSDHLILLVGGNPLPNAVAGSCLLAEGGKITLVYSKTQKVQTARRQPFKIEGTQKVAQRLRRWFVQERRLTEHVYLQPVDDSDAWDIRVGIQTALQNSSDSVGLHYSGGTKAMAIHAYRAVQEKTKGEAVFSYLNPRTLEMFFDRPDDEAERVSVGTAVNITLEEMLFLQTSLRLHRKRPYLDVPLLPRTAQAVMRVHTAGGAELAAWKNWRQTAAGRYYKIWYDNGIPRNWKPAADIYNAPLPEPPPTSIGQTLLDELGQSGNLSIQGVWQKQPAGRWASEQDFIDEFLGFLLGGKWLEHYTLDCVQALREKFAFHQTLLGIVPARAGRNNKEDDALFELDVAAIRGYQLFAFSCGTGKKLKLKLFEAEKRARQLGGDEARVALICLADPAAVRQLEQVTRETIDLRIKLFGKNDLPQLTERLGEWLDTQTGR